MGFFQNTCGFTSDRSRNSRRIAAATRGTVKTLILLLYLIYGILSVLSIVFFFNGFFKDFNIFFLGVLSCFCGSRFGNEFTRLMLYNCGEVNSLSNVNGKLICQREATFFEEQEWISYENCKKSPDGPFRNSCPHCTQNECKKIFFLPHNFFVTRTNQDLFSEIHISAPTYHPLLNKNTRLLDLNQGDGLLTPKKYFYLRKLKKYFKKYTLWVDCSTKELTYIHWLFFSTVLYDYNSCVVYCSLNSKLTIINLCAVGAKFV